ncbi:unnamed protein product [Eruca vesicaria subsp. sativa]|uniref:Uncharacterized protein n=1 Tax=Eruca vesicaria subsp. sativa TaxID=29727 RepID=A0ABC8LSN0_ERUVS|nr:unnamed protein product [Eruca vesicaria subsp. sativa]
MRYGAIQEQELMDKEFKTHTMEHRPKKMKKPKGGEEKNVKVEDGNARFILSNPDVVERVYTMGTEIMNRAKVNCIQSNWAVNVVILTLECISGWMMINDQTYHRVQKVPGHCYFSTRRKLLPLTRKQLTPSSSISAGKDSDYVQNCCKCTISYTV